ncbi:hypothetical protein Tco_0312168 [Tanacetum coccineum]
MAHSTFPRTIYTFGEYDPTDSPVRQPTFDSDKDPNEHWDSDLQRGVVDTVATPEPPPTQQGPYLRRTAQIRVVDPLMMTFQTSSPYHSQLALGTYHMGGLSPSGPSPHVLPGTSVGFMNGLTRFEQERMLLLSEATHTSRYRQDLQARMMNDVLGIIQMMDGQLMWIQHDSRETRAESRRA